LFLVNYGTNQDTSGLQVTYGGNTLIGGTTDITGSGGLKVFGTTASTSTTTGALQVAGGVGVAGAVWSGGFVSSTTATGLNLTGSNASIEIGAVGATNTPYIDFHSSASSTDYDTRLIASSGTSGNGAGVLTILTGTLASAAGITFTNTTASTSTTTGALQVAGGVGIGGNLHIGGTTIGLVHNTTISGGGGVGPLKMECTADAGSTVISAGTTSGYVSQVIVNARSNASPGIRFSTRNTERMVIADATGDATFNGAIAIGNTVNTVTATLPNRTITMVIGGTTYYIHAKTTND
jgi:hypothetical protein